MEICDGFSGCGDPSAWNHTCDVVLCGGRTKEKEEDKARKKQMEFDYPQLISRFTLYLGAGLPVRNAWSKIVQSYEEEEKETGAGKFMRKWHIQCMKSAVERRKANVMNGLENDVDSRSIGNSEHCFHRI